MGLTPGLWGQSIDKSKMPTDESLTAAKQLVTTFFENLKNNKHKENADFIVESLGANWDESKKITELNDYLAKFEIISLKPPKGVFGKLFDYDLIEEGFLPGSDRYFRHTYISYHEGSILVWEFRFYVTEDKSVTLHYIGWTDSNPFEYMSTPDMILSIYH